MNYSNYRLSLDIHETESGLSLRAKKGDTIRKIYVTLMDGGAPYRITPDCTAAFTARKPDTTSSPSVNTVSSTSRKNLGLVISRPSPP